MQEATLLFRLFWNISQFMEGDSYILASSLWPALSSKEKALEPVVTDSPAVASLRAAMSADHFNRRVTLQASVQTPMHVMMAMLDPRYALE